MTRYCIQGRKKQHEIVIGWDRPLHTYFAQVWDKNDHSEDPILWAGVAFAELPSCQHLERLLKPYADIPEDLCIQLTQDKEQPVLDLIRDMWSAATAEAERGDTTSPIEPEE